MNDNFHQDKVGFLVLILQKQEKATEVKLAF